jgi:dihydroorotate dehydrogenase
VQRLGAAAAATAATAAVAFLPDVRFEVASLAGPVLQALDPETAHRWGIEMAKLGLFPRDGRLDDPRLRVQLWGRTFSNPIGIAAGFDKDAEAVEGILSMGVGFMEVGARFRCHRLCHWPKHERTTEAALLRAAWQIGRL